jgi:hypothetical protein
MNCHCDNIFTAITAGHPNCIKCFSSQVNTMLKDVSGFTRYMQSVYCLPIQMAISRKRNEELKLLIQLGANINVDNSFLADCVEYKNMEAMAILLNEGINVPSHGVNEPVNIAAGLYYMGDATEQEKELFKEMIKLIESHRDKEQLFLMVKEPAS